MDTHLFIDIILTEGAIEAYIDPEFPVITYIGPHNIGKAWINTDEEVISRTVGEDLLRKLGMNDLIGKLPFTS
jgi:hypothetical protein